MPAASTATTIARAFIREQSPREAALAIIHRVATNRRAAPRQQAPATPTELSPEDPALADVRETPMAIIAEPGILALSATGCKSLKSVAAAVVPEPVRKRLWGVALLAVNVAAIPIVHPESSATGSLYANRAAREVGVAPATMVIRRQEVWAPE